GNSNKENQFNDNDKVSIGIYLIFFETLYYFYKRDLIKIDDINDLFAQRFFIAVHNPDVQKYLIKNCIFYKNVFKLYDELIKLRDDNGQFVLGDEKYKLSNGKFVAYRLYSKELESRYGEYSYDRLLNPDNYWRDILNPKNMNTPPNEDNQKIEDAIKEPKIQL
ncbi:MAG: hypothetical protein J6104_00200, partial [Methanomicrobium sp.]|nr:hypothetical protein [Methanomicrobium sp.]